MGGRGGIEQSRSSLPQSASQRTWLAVVFILTHLAGRALGQNSADTPSASTNNTILLWGLVGGVLLLTLIFALAITCMCVRLKMNDKKQARKRSQVRSPSQSYLMMSSRSRGGTMSDCSITSTDSGIHGNDGGLATAMTSVHTGLSTLQPDGSSSEILIERAQIRQPPSPNIVQTYQMTGSVVIPLPPTDPEQPVTTANGIPAEALVHTPAGAATRTRIEYSDARPTAVPQLETLEERSLESSRMSTLQKHSAANTMEKAARHSQPSAMQPGMEESVAITAARDEAEKGQQVERVAGDIAEETQPVALPSYVTTDNTACSSASAGSTPPSEGAREAGGITEDTELEVDIPTPAGDEQLLASTGADDPGNSEEPEPESEHTAQQVPVPIVTVGHDEGVGDTSSAAQPQEYADVSQQPELTSVSDGDFSTLDELDRALDTTEDGMSSSDEDAVATDSAWQPTSGSAALHTSTPLPEKSATMDASPSIDISAVDRSGLADGEDRGSPEDGASQTNGTEPGVDDTLPPATVDSEPARGFDSSYGNGQDQLAGMGIGLEDELWGTTEEEAPRQDNIWDAIHGFYDQSASALQTSLMAADRSNVQEDLEQLNMSLDTLDTLRRLESKERKAARNQKRHAQPIVHTHDVPSILEIFGPGTQDEAPSGTDSPQRAPRHSSPALVSSPNDTLLVSSPNDTLLVSSPNDTLLKSVDNAEKDFLEAPVFKAPKDEAAEGSGMQASSNSLFVNPMYTPREET